MGDTFHDPVDHLRTTRPLAGESLIDVMHWPGYLLVVAGVIGACGSLAAFGTGHHHVGMTAGVLAGIATVLGLGLGGNRAPADPPDRGPLVRRAPRGVPAVARQLGVRPPRPT